MSEIETNESLVLGQKYAFATASLILGICCFVNLLGLEKAILAIVFAWLALRTKPEPVLKEHRMWAKAGLVLGILPLIILPILIISNFDRLREIIDVLSKLNGGR
ncbi:MAG: hypothetical protein ACR2M8_09885 [Pyrinomonadaceae bacterium]|nr:hypothetical protein [Blastocatellia bacterium]MDQ3221159.1 hypothetical protein [Acidobacteriota bacterium]MDQ3489868.1 hypothetical protein [Acidobacteriota bacterium]